MKLSFNNTDLRKLTMYKNNSDFSAKFKVNIFVQSSVINLKATALKSATILILNVGTHSQKT